MIVTVDTREYARLLGYPWGTPLAGDVLERAESAIAWYRDHGNPRAYVHREGDEIIAALTAGREAEEEVDRLWKDGRVDEAYFLDRYAAAVVRTMASRLGPYQSPGCGRIPFEEQFRLFSYIAPQSPEIEMLSSGMLRPKNSLMAIVRSELAMHVEEFVACSCCGLPKCAYRRPLA